MSHVEAYRCDMCQVIQPANVIVGVSLQQDMFDTMRSFEIILTATGIERAKAHYCHDCYEKHVLEPARLSVNRKKEENAYMAKLRELQYNLRKLTVLRYGENLSKKR